MLQTPKLLSDAERFKFYDYYTPSLTDGDYTLTITPIIRLDPAPPLVECIKNFKVEGPRFALEQQDLHAFFPPKNSSGNFSTCLPHIIFNKKALPWERSLKAVQSLTEVQSLKEEKTITPWLALICLDQSEYSQCRVLPQPIKVQDWLGKKSDDFIYPDIEIGDLGDEEKTLNCQILQIPSTIFLDIVPTVEELPYLAHIRQVSSETTPYIKAKMDEEKANLASSSDSNNASKGSKLSLAEKFDTEHADYFSVLVCNRFPNSNTQVAEGIKHYVFLVSLEGFENYINKHEVTQANVRIATLANWSFTCLPAPKETFSGLMRNIFEEQASNIKFLNLPPLSENVPDEENKEKAKKLNPLFNKGYVPLIHRLSTAETTWAWYRGPLVPDKTVLPQEQDFSQSSKAAYIYLSDQEVFDVSYAIAWELGRLLAMANPNFISTLMQLRYQIHQNTQQSARLQELSDQFYQTAGKKFNSQSGLLSLFAQKMKLDLKVLQKDYLDTENKNSYEQNSTNSTSLKENQDPLQRRYKFKSQLMKKHREHQLTASNNSSSSAQEDDGTNILLSSLLEWLNALRLLKNIPFQYLVVDPKLLPINSIRFFYIDEMWFDQIEEGCFSLGLHCDKDNESNKFIKNEIREKRKSLSLPVAGFLLHSPIVSGWPDLIVEFNAKKGEKINMLRKENLGENVLLCLFDKYPEAIEIKEPEKHMSFGGEGNSFAEAEFSYRYINTTDSHETGENVSSQDRGEGRLFIHKFLDRKDLRTLNISPNKEKSILNAYKTQFKRDLTPSEFALQLIKTPLKVRFKIP